MAFWNLIEKDDSKGLEALIVKSSIDRNIVDQFGLSPILYALSKGSLNCAKVLIKCQFNLSLKDNKGQTALHYCAFYNYIDIASLLIEDATIVNIEDDYGNQPLWTAVFNDKGFGQRLDIINLLLESGADINHKNKAGRTPKDFSIGAGYSEVVNLLNR